MRAGGKERRAVGRPSAPRRHAPHLSLPGLTRQPISPPAPPVRREPWTRGTSPRATVEEAATAAHPTRAASPLAPPTPVIAGLDPATHACHRPRSEEHTSELQSIK